MVSDVKIRNMYDLQSQQAMTYASCRSDKTCKITYNTAKIKESKASSDSTKTLSDDS